jgi:hypothetical protein
MFFGHLFLVIILFPLSYFKGFDDEEFNISFWILFLVFLGHGVSMIKYLISTESNRLIIEEFNQKLVFGFFFVLASTISMKANFPNIINFNEMWAWIGVLEFFLHGYIFFVYIGAKNKE